METVTLEAVLESRDLPSMPKVALDVLELARDPDVRAIDVARAVQFDQALTAKILRTVNSSFYGLAHPCASVERATAYLGINAVKSIVLGLSLVQLVRRGGRGLDLVDYFRRCTYSAAAARRIARHTTCCDPEEAHIAALMQDIGMLSLHTVMCQQYGDVVGGVHGDHRLLPQRELRSLGFTHADAGAGLGERWRLPAQIIEPIRHHHTGQVVGDAVAKIVQTVSMSYRMATILAYDGGGEELRTVHRMGERFFGLSIEEVGAILEESSQDALALAGLLEVKIGRSIDVTRVLAEAREAIEHHGSESAEEVHEPEHEDAGPAFVASLSRTLKAAVTAGDDLGLVLVAPDAKGKLDLTDRSSVDAALEEIRARITLFAASNVTIARHGACRLAVLAPRADRTRATAFAEGIRARIAMAPFFMPDEAGRRGSPVRITASVGVAAFDLETRAVLDRPEVLVRAAERALLIAQETGNTVEAFGRGRTTL